MAFILDQQEEEQNGQGQSTQQPLSGGQSAQVGGGSNTTQNASAGVGKGGQGGWTNLQSYLGANTGNTGGSQILDKNVSSQFGQEKSKIQDDSTSYVSNAQKQIDDNKVTTEQADQAINDAAMNYDWGGQHKAGYTATVDKMKNALTGSYQGPTSYNYSFGADTQNYGNALRDDNSFNKLMGDMYSKTAGGPLSTGQRALQNQLDVNNDDLQTVRSKLLNDYSGLNDFRDQAVNDTTQKLSNVERDYRTSQNALRDYLSGKTNELDTSIARQEADARKGYNDAFNSGSGRKALGYDTIAGIKGNNAEIAPRTNLGVWGDNLTFSQLQREGDAFKNGELKWYTPDRDPDLASKQALLNEFYSGQDAKYANTADEDERRYNALADFLGLSGKKEQGFKVRG